MNLRQQVDEGVTEIFSVLAAWVETATHTIPVGSPTMDPTTGRNVTPPPQTQTVQVLEDDMTMELAAKHGVPVSSLVWVGKGSDFAVPPAVGHTLTIGNQTYTLTAVGRGPGYWELFV